MLVSLRRYLDKKRYVMSFSSNALKLIAMITMLIDHIAFALIINGKLYGYDYSLYENVINLPEAKNWLIISSVCRHIGRISFPIFAFLIVEGFRKTSNISKYILRMAVFAIISEIPFDLMVSNRIFYGEAQNVLWTYLLGLIMLVPIKILSMDSDALHIIIFLVTLTMAYFFKADYAIEGILLIFIFYKFRHDLYLKLGLAILITFVGSVEKYHGIACLSVPFMFFYDGSKGYLNLGRFPYLFYPLHMLILYGIVFFSYIRL